MWLSREELDRRLAAVIAQADEARVQRSEAELAEARALIADLHRQLDAANAAAVRLAAHGDFWRVFSRAKGAA